MTITKKEIILVNVGDLARVIKFLRVTLINTNIKIQENEKICKMLNFLILFLAIIRLSIII